MVAARLSAHAATPPRHPRHAPPLRPTPHPSAPPTRGLALAGTAHGGGLLGLSDEPEAFPFAALSMNLCGAAAVILVSCRPVRRLLLAVAVG